MRGNGTKAVRLLNIALLAALAGCAGVDYSQYDGLPAEGRQVSEREITAFGRLTSGARLIETFNDAELSTDMWLNGKAEELVSRGALRLQETTEEDRPRITLRSAPSSTFTSITVCWKLEGDGQLLLWTTVPGLGRPTFVLSDSGYGGHVHIAARGGEAKHIPYNATDYAAGRWVLTEIRVEDGEVLFLFNGRVHHRFAAEGASALKYFTLGTNNGGSGRVDYLIVK